MVIEDDPIIRNELETLLQGNGYMVVSIKDFSKVCNTFQVEAPHLVLLDIKLPNESGFSICSQIRIHSDVPIIFKLWNEGRNLRYYTISPFLNLLCEPIYVTTQTKRICNPVYLGYGRENHCQTFLCRNICNGTSVYFDWNFSWCVLLPAHHSHVVDHLWKKLYPIMDTVS